MTKLGSGPDHCQSGQAGKRADFLCREGDFVGAQRNSDSPGLFQKPTRANPIYGDVEGAPFRIGEHCVSSVAKMKHSIRLTRAALEVSSTSNISVAAGRS